MKPSGLGMKAWLYDEGGWPSGSATGRVVKSDPNLAAQTLVAERRPLAPGEKPATQPGRLRRSSKTASTLVVCRIRRNNFQPDHLNPAATRRFIELTHEGYRRSMPQYLGRSCRGPSPMSPPSPLSFPASRCPGPPRCLSYFREKKGYDLIEIAAAAAVESAIARLREGRCRRESISSTCGAELFQEAYLLPIRDWCREVRPAFRRPFRRRG